jgi:hypothetical protein
VQHGGSLLQTRADEVALLAWPNIAVLDFVASPKW